VRNFICIGASAGGLEALKRLIRQVPADLPAAIYIVRHIAPSSSGLLAEILQPHCSLPIGEAVDGQRIESGRVMIAPANRHLLLDRVKAVLHNGPKENWARPAIDPLFRSVAQHHGPRSIGIMLSGKLDDGTAGLWALKRRGGFAVVQTPGDATEPEMPACAVASVDVDVVADAEEIGASLASWCKQSSTYKASSVADKTIEAENEFLLRGGSKDALDTLAEAASIICPDCGGPLWRMKEGPLRFRCHVGHAHGARSLLIQQKHSVEEAGWILVRALEEDNQLTMQMLGSDAAAELKQVLEARLQSNQDALKKVRPILRSELLNDQHELASGE
jgi:two-component system chemotaxis response regulator CheB